jgi:hypothetical protein
MKPSEQRKEEFLQELRTLCIKHKCELSISDDGKPYGAQSPIAVLCFDGVYDENNETVEEFGCFVIDGFYFDSKE